MKSNKMPFLLVAMFLLAGVSTSFAQYDDLYYNPDTDGEYNYTSPFNDAGSQNNSFDEDDYYGEEYEYDDYNYHYSSRIRRFHRPYYGFSYFDPVYVDMAYYDPFWSPGLATMLIYDDFWSYRSWRRWNRWNAGFGWSPFGPAGNGFGSPWRNRWNDPFLGGGFGNTYVVNNFYGNGFGNGFGGGFGNGFGGGFYGASNYGSYYCPPSWGSGFSYNTVANVNNSYYGSRRSGVRPETGGPGSLRAGTPQTGRNDREANATRQSMGTPRTGQEQGSQVSDRDAIRRELNENRGSSAAGENTGRDARSPNPGASPSRNTERNTAREGVERSGTSRGTYDSPSRESGNRSSQERMNNNPRGSGRSSGGDYNNSRSRGSSLDSPGNNSRSNNWNSGGSPSRNSGGSFNSGGSSRGSSGGGFNSGGGSRGSSGGGSSRGGGRGL